MYYEDCGETCAAVRRVRRVDGDCELSSIKEVLRWWLSILEAQTE